MQTWSTMLYKLVTIDESLASSDIKSIINKYFTKAQREDVFSYLLLIFNSNLFQNKVKSHL